MLKNIGFVPTMGSLHKGHISLIKKSLSQSSKTLVSIYVNKPQFNKTYDFKSYPRNLRKDISILKKIKVDYLYIPVTKDIYPKGPNKNIRIDKFEKRLCGKFRPGHFKAVADVVYRFIKIINPKRIYLGEKDMQQLKLIEKFFKQKYIKTKIISCKTIRERNGIPCSSRNILLNKKEKQIASKIYKFLINKKNKIVKNKIKTTNLIDHFFKIGVSKVDYIELLDINKIIKPYRKKNNYKIFIAYYLNKTRLIDNI